jgi:hypothetical protein
MPVALLPAIAAIAALAGTGITVGETLANQPSGKPPTATPAPAVSPAMAPQIKAAISGQDANIQAQTGGSLSPDYLTQIAPILAGTAGPGTSGIAQGATNTFTGGANNPIAQVLRTLSTGGGGGAAPSASAQSFTPAGLAPSPGGSDLIDSGLSTLYKNLGITG